MYLLTAQQAGELYWRTSREGRHQSSRIEVADAGDGVAMRHSKDLGGPAPVYTRGEFEAFLDGARQGEFNDLC